MPVKLIKKADDTNYVPNCQTPLNNAIGISLTRLESAISQEAQPVVLVSIITDGYENDSKVFDQQTIAALVKRLRQKGWTITYMGANQTAEEVAMSMNIINALNFDANREGVEIMHLRAKSSMRKLFNALKDEKNRMREKSNYFQDGPES